MNQLPLKEYIALANGANKKPNTNKNIQVTSIETGLGTMIAASTNEGICMLEFPEYSGLLRELKQIRQYSNAQLIEGQNIYLSLLQIQLAEYFSGKRMKFDIPLDCIGTDFQKKVWRSLLTIPYGTTLTYSELACKIGNSSAVRAVANANGHNKIAIMTPCHRVIGTNGTLIGYAGGIERKETLLTLEHRYTVS